VGPHFNFKRKKKALKKKKKKKQNLNPGFLGGVFIMLLDVKNEEEQF